MKIGKPTHQLADKFMARELEETFVNLYRAGNAIQAVTNALIEVAVAKENGDELCFMKPYDSGNLMDALDIIGGYIEYESYCQAKRFGFDEPS